MKNIILNRFFKYLALIISVLSLIFLTCSCYFLKPSSETVDNTDSKTVKSGVQANFSDDANFAVEKIEEVHPIFSIPAIPDGYDSAKAEYLEVASKPMSYAEFLLATQKYLAVLGDGHMGAGLFTTSKYVDIKWIANNGRLYLLDEQNKPTDVEIITIGGVPASNVTTQVDIYYAAENDAARQRNYSVFCTQREMLDLAGCSHAGSVELGMSNGETISCGFMLKPHSGTPNANYIIRHEIINGDVFYINLRTFQPDKSVDNTAEEIKKAIQDGMTKFIIDVRDNGGGDSNVGEQLLQAMGMNTPQYGAYIRNSKLLSEQRGGYKFSKESEIYEPNIKNAVSNDKITLAVLTNVNTFSSATMLGVWVQDGKLGKVIGQISSNAPNCYGDMLNIYLPVSKVNLRVSYKRFLRPDINANPDSLIPDIEVPFGEDILAAALKYMDSIE